MLWVDSAEGGEEGYSEADLGSLPWRHRGLGPWWMAFLLATCGMIRPTPGGSGSHPWVPRDPAACPGLGHECDSLPACILSPPGGLDSGFVPSTQDFNKKLTEADAYLQILIEQLKLFDDKLQNCFKLQRWWTERENWNPQRDNR